MAGWVEGALVGLGVAMLGLGVLQAAIAFFNEPRYWSADFGTGGNAITFVFLGSILIDLAWISGRSWSEVKRSRSSPQPDRGDWFALGLASSFFLILIGTGVLAVVILVIWASVNSGRG